MPKKLLVEQGAPTAADKRQIQDGIEEMIWVAALKPTNIGVPAFRDDVREYLEIAVLTVALRPAAKPTRLIELIHRAIPYPLVLVTSARRYRQPFAGAQTLVAGRGGQGGHRGGAAGRAQPGLPIDSGGRILGQPGGVAACHRMNLFTLYDGCWTARRTGSRQDHRGICPTGLPEQAYAMRDGLDRTPGSSATLPALGPGRKKKSRLIEAWK